MEEPAARLRIKSLYVEGLKSIERLELPRDGMDWDNEMPSFAVIGGVNGSGKTSLLEWIFAAYALFFVELMPPDKIACQRGLMDVGITLNQRVGTVRIVVTKDSERAWGEQKCSETSDAIYYSWNDEGVGRVLSTQGDFARWIRDLVSNLLRQPESHHQVTIPVVLYFPAEDRALDLPEEKYKSAGKLMGAPDGIRVRFRRARENWIDSTEAVLFDARWRDLNALDQNIPSPRAFEKYVSAFRDFFGGTKSLVWEQGDLMVKVGDTLHPLHKLSSGEKQVILIYGELLRWLEDGSIVLIDEPEMHMHPSWQRQLLRSLHKWVVERGGQVILATQSTEIFDEAEYGTKLLLGRGL